MKHPLLLLFLLFQTSLFAQQVLSDDVTSTRRHRYYRFHRSVIYTPYSADGPVVSNTLAISPATSVSPLPKAIIRAGSMAAPVSAPFTEYSQSTIGRRHNPLFGYDDPGTQDTVSPIGNEMILLWFALAVVLLKLKQEFNNT